MKLHTLVWICRLSVHNHSTSECLLRVDSDILYQDPIATYNPAPISNLTTALPQIHFDEYFSTFAPRNYPDRVIITYPPYAHSLSEILNNTSKDVVEAYLVVRAALSLSSYLGMGTEAWQAQRTLVETLSGIKKGAVGDRAEYCVGQVEGALGFAAGRYFVNETFSGESKEKGTKVITGEFFEHPHLYVLIPSQTSSRHFNGPSRTLIGWMNNLQRLRQIRSLFEVTVSDYNSRVTARSGSNYSCQSWISSLARYHKSRFYRILLRQSHWR